MGVTESTAVPPRMGLLTFVTVSVASMAGAMAATLLFGAFAGEDDTAPILVGLLALPMSSLAAALAFLFVARFETGRKGLAALAVFLCSLAATIVFAGLYLLGLVLASVAAGGFGVFARRLLDSPKNS